MSNRSSFSYPKHLTSEPDEQLIEKANRCLISSNELARLTAYIPSRLIELKWSERVLDLCQEYIRNYDNKEGIVGRPEPSNIPVEEIVKNVTPQAKLLFPKELYKQLEDRIVEFIGEQSID